MLTGLELISSEQIDELLRGAVSFKLSVVRHSGVSSDVGGINASESSTSG